MRSNRVIKLSEIVGRIGAFDLLSKIEGNPGVFDSSSIYDVMSSAGVEDPDGLYNDLIQNGIVTQYGRYYSLSTFGAKTLLLLQAVNGEDIELVYRRLAGIYPELRHYELVREGMVLKFIYDLYAQPNFGRIYFCSPLINLEKKTLGRLAQALRWAEERFGKRTVEVLVIHGAFKGDEKEDRPFKETLNALSNLGAEIRIHPKYPKLHVKLYIREPSFSGGLLRAVVGSQNLTRSRNIELGIWITNDSEMIGNLIREFYEIYNTGEKYN